MTIVVLSADKMYVSVYISAKDVGVTKTLKSGLFRLFFILWFILYFVGGCDLFSN